MLTQETLLPDLYKEKIEDAFIGNITKEHLKSSKLSALTDRGLRIPIINHLIKKCNI